MSNKTLLDKAQQIKQKSTDIGFDTNDSVEKAFNKINEEFLELKKEVEEYLISINQQKGLKETDSTPIQKEMGDLMFAICSLANKLGIRAQDCLKMTVNKFTTEMNMLKTNSVKMDKIGKPAT